MAIKFGSILQLNNASAEATLDSNNLRGTTLQIDGFNSASLATIGAGLVSAVGKRRLGTIIATTGSATSPVEYYAYIQTSSGDANLSGSEWTTLSNWEPIISDITSTSVSGAIDIATGSLSASLSANTFKTTGQRSGDSAITGSLTLSGSGDIYLNVKGNITASGLNLTDLSNVTSTTALMLNSSNIVGTKALGTNAFTNDALISQGNLTANVFPKITDEDGRVTEDSFLFQTGSTVSASGDFIAANITASGNISASGNLYASVTNNSDTALKTVMYNTLTGKFFRTGSYGGGGGGGGTTPSLQQVTTVGDTTATGIYALASGVTGNWGGWTGAVAQSGFFKDAASRAKTYVTPQPYTSRFVITGNPIDLSYSQALRLSRYPDNYIVYGKDGTLISTDNGRPVDPTDDSPDDGKSVLQYKGGAIELSASGSSDSTAHRGIQITTSNIAFFNNDASSSLSGSFFPSSASAQIKFDTGSSAIRFLAGSTTEELKEVLFISKSGVNPRIGIGTNDPIRAFDFKEIRDDSRGGEILIRGSRTDKGADNGDEVGRINFAIDSSSYNKVDTSGSAAEIVALVDSVDTAGVQGSLSLRVAASKTAEPIQRIKAIGYVSPTDNALEFTGSADFDSNISIGGIINSNITSSGTISASGDLTVDSVNIASGGGIGLSNNYSGMSFNNSGNTLLGFGGSWNIQLNKDNGVVLYELGNLGLYRDFRIEGNSDPHLLFVTGGDARIGIGTSTPTSKLEVSGDITSTNITASGNISASGNIYAADYFDNGTNISSIYSPIAGGSGITTVGTLGSLTVTGNITANGNIVGDDGTNITNIAEVQCDSIASDAGSTTKIIMGAATIDVLVDDTDVFNVSPTLFTHDTPVKFSSHITSSGNISSSGNVYAADYFDNGTNISSIYQSTLTFGISDTNVFKADSGIVDNDFLRVNGTVIEGRSSGQVLSDIGAQSSIGDGDLTIAFTDGLQDALDAKQATLTFGKSSGNALKSEEALTTNDVLLMGASNVKGRTYAELKSDLSLNNVENTAISTFAGTTNITTVGTLGSLTVSGDITANGNIVGDDGTDITNIESIFADNLVHDGDTDTKIAFGTNTVQVDAGGRTVFESSVTGSVLSKVHQNVYDTGSLAISTANGAMGDIVKFGGSTTIAGGMYYLKGDGTWALTQANAVGTATSSIAIAVGTNSTTHGMCLRGFVNPFTDPGAGTGNPVYMSDVSTGRMLATAPSSTGDVVRIIGYQYGPDLIYFNPSNDYIVHA